MSKYPPYEGTMCAYIGLFPEQGQRECRVATIPEGEEKRSGFPAGDYWGLFVEVFGEVPMSADGGPVHLLDAGVTYLVRPHVQLDLAAGVGLSDDAPDWFAGMGVSLRFPR